MRQKSYTYSIVLTPAEEGGYTVIVPALAGCVTEGDTVEEALTNAREAITLTIDALTAHGDPIPHESSPALASTITIPDWEYA